MVLSNVYTCTLFWHYLFSVSCCIGGVFDSWLGSDVAYLKAGMKSVPEKKIKQVGTN